MKITTIKRGELFKALYENKVAFATKEDEDETLVILVNLYGAKASMIIK